MTNKANAMQHIYTRVSEFRSPWNREGFQTLFVTQEGLRPKSAAAILEPRLFYYDPIKRKRFFFSVGTDPMYMVVSNIIRLEDLDEHGRGGLYLGHTLVMKREDFLILGSNPYAVFDSFEFASSIDEACALGEITTGNIPPVQLEPSDALEENLIESAEKWDSSEIHKVASLAINAMELTDKGQCIALVGSQKSIDDFLRLIFLLLPPQLVRFCTFDTCCLDSSGSQANITKASSTENNKPRIVYWALGFPKNVPDNEKFLIVDVDSRKVPQESTIKKSNSTFELWLREQVQDYRWSTILKHKEQAYAASTAVDKAIMQFTEPQKAVPGVLQVVIDQVAKIYLDLREQRNQFDFDL